MYCRECGKQIPDDSRFCPECGKPVSVRPKAEPAPAPNPAPAPAPAPTPAPTPKKKKKTGLVIGLIAGGVVLLAAIAVAVLFFLGIIGGGKGGAAKSPEAAAQNYAAALAEGDMARVASASGLDLRAFLNATFQDELDSGWYSSEQELIEEFVAQVSMAASMSMDSEFSAWFAKESAGVKDRDDLIDFVIELYPRVLKMQFAVMTGSDYTVTASMTGAPVPAQAYEWGELLEDYDVYEAMQMNVLLFTYSDIRTVAEVEFDLTMSGGAINESETLDALAIETEDGWYLVGYDVWGAVGLF